MPRQKSIKFTTHNYLLDEVQSLFMKSFLRKEQKYTLSSAKELLQNSNHLPNHLLIDSLFGDHCLCDEKTLEKFHHYITSKDKKGFIQLLLNTKTCNISWCLPIVSLEYKYHLWKQSDVNEIYKDLVEENVGLLRFYMVLGEFINAWNSCSEDKIIAYGNLLHVIQTVEVRLIKQKGVEIMKSISNFRCKPKICTLVIAVLYENCKTDERMKKYLKSCFLFSCVTGVNLSLILFSIISMKLYGSDVKPASSKSREIDWNSVDELNDMPQWAVDIHTYRGFNGRDTLKFLDSKQKDVLGIEKLEQFHGIRPKKDIDNLFVENITNNKFYNRTREIYSCYPKQEQHITKMIKRFVEHLKKEHLFLFNS